MVFFPKMLWSPVKSSNNLRWLRRCVVLTVLTEDSGSWTSELRNRLRYSRYLFCIRIQLLQHMLFSPECYPSLVHTPNQIIMFGFRFLCFVCHCLIVFVAFNCLVLQVPALPIYWTWLMDILLSCVHPAHNQVEDDTEILIRYNVRGRGPKFWTGT